MNKGAHMQLGKNGVTLSFVETLQRLLLTHTSVRISALPASGRSRAGMHELVASLAEQLPFSCASTVIGFTIILHKNKKNRR
jgi:RNA-binding protein YhbY